MRTLKDRIRHTVLFEIMGLLIVTFTLTCVMKTAAMRIGVLSVGMCIWAMVWNAIYNYVFDLVLVHAGHSLKERSVRLRTVHTILFELGLQLFALPAVAWWMNMTLLQAVVMNLGFALFYLVYGFIYNWLYDMVFPLPDDIESAGGIGLHSGKI